VAYWTSIYKLRLSFPLNYFILLKSYLTNRHFRVKVHNEFSDLPIHAGVPQGSVLDPRLYLLYTSDLPSSPDTIAIAIDLNAVAASKQLQTSLDAIHHWLSLWRLKANGSKSTHITFTNRQETCPAVYIINEPLPQAEDVKYLGLHLDRRLTWHKHIFTKRKNLGTILT
jgi:hypothetical protein